MVRIRNAISLKLLATPPGFEPGTFSLEGYEETLYYQRPVILFRSENWPIAQLKYHRTPSQLWTADRTRGIVGERLIFRRSGVDLSRDCRLQCPCPLPVRAARRTFFGRCLWRQRRLRPSWDEARRDSLHYPAGVARFQRHRDRGAWSFAPSRSPKRTIFDRHSSSRI
jgi:hypothetical protein